MEQTQCPVCHGPMAKPRTYCSRACYAADRAAKGRDVDKVVVDRLCYGDRVTSTKAERIEAVRILTEKGQSAWWIALLLHTTPRSIQRYRAVNKLSLTQKAA